MKLLQSIPITQNYKSIAIPAGKYSGFLINFVGVNQAAQTLAVSSLGTIRMLSRGRQFQLIEFERLQYINNLKRGAVSAASAAGGAFVFSAILPMAVPRDPSNCLFVEQDGEVVMELNGFYSAGVAVILSGDVRIYGIEAEGIHKYYLNINQHDFNTVLGNGSEGLTGLENFYEIFIKNEANLASLTVNVDGISKEADSTLQVLIDKTNFDNAIETYSASIPYIDIPISGTGEFSDALGDTCSLLYRVTTAAISPLKVVCFNLDFDPTKEAASALALQGKVQMKLVQKHAQGKERAVRSIAG